MWNVLVRCRRGIKSLLHTSNHSDPPFYTIPNKVPAPNKHTVTSGRRPMAPRASNLLKPSASSGADQRIDCPIIRGPRWKQQ